MKNKELKIKAEKNIRHIQAAAILIVLLTLTAAVVLFIGIGEEEIFENIVVYNGVWLRRDGDAWTVINVNKSATAAQSLDIPTEVQGDPVVRIEKIPNAEGYTHLSIPSTVIEIDDEAFSYMTSLKFIVVAQENRFFRSENGILYDVNGETLIKVPQAYGFTWQNELVLPEGVKYIARRAFYKCNVMLLKVPTTLLTMGEGAFEKCVLISRISNMENSQLVRIGRNCFAGCQSLQSITLPASLISVESDAFNHCDSLSEFIVVDGNKEFSVNDGILLTADGKGLLSYPSGRKRSDVQLPEGIERIETGSFASNANIISLTMPESVKYINVGAFNKCTKLSAIIMTGDTPPEIDVRVGDVNNASFFTVSDNLGAFRNHDVWGSINVYPYAVSGEYAYMPLSMLEYYDKERYSKLTQYSTTDQAVVITAHLGGQKAEIPSTITTQSGSEVSVTGALKGAFNRNTLIEIVFSDSFVYIGKNDFEGFTELMRVTFGTSVREIDDEAFKECTGLQRVEFSQKDKSVCRIERIGERAFSECTMLNHVELPSLYFRQSTIMVSDQCFFGCIQLSTVAVYGRVSYQNGIESVSDSFRLTLVIDDELFSYFFTQRHMQMWNVKENQMVRLSLYGEYL